MTATPGTPDSNANRQAQGHRGLALGWLKRGRAKQAILSLQTALELDPKYLEAHLDLARVLLQLRRWQDLIDFCRHSLVYFSEVPELHKMLITALEERGSWEEACSYYELERRDRRALDIAPDEILCCLVARNERPRLPYFLRYYRGLGVDRFLVIDNGSHDGSVEWLLDQPDVHVWHSNLSFRQANFGSAWFELLLRRFGVDHWCLTLDADEFLYFEGLPGRSLKHFCRDLERRNKRAATGLLLDLYSDRPIRETQYREGDDPLALCPFFDRLAFHRRYESGGQYHNQDIFFGGVRQRVFPVEHDYLLSKCVLLQYRPEVVLTSGQHLTNIAAPYLAREEVCLLHFKFFASFVDYAREEARREVHSLGAEQYKGYKLALDHDEDLVLYDPEQSLRFEGAAQLRALGILRAEPPAPDPRVPAIAPLRPADTPRPFWSVIITVYDRVANIERVLSSVLQQADESMQIEVVCDFSDAARQQAIAAEVARLGLGRAQFHPLPSRLGHPHIFNYCLGLASGQWVHIVHDDDWVEPGFYRTLRAHIDATPDIGAAFCQHSIVAGGHPTVWRSWVERETPGVIDDWLDRIALECRVQFSAMAVRRDVYEAVGGFCPDAGSAFDWEMWVRIAARYPVFYVPEVLVSVGRDQTAESSILLRSGEEVLHAFTAIDVAARHLPVDRAEALTRKARDRIASYALEVAQQFQERGDAAATLANVRAAVNVRPSPRTLRLLLDFLRPPSPPSSTTADPAVDAVLLGRTHMDPGQEAAAEKHLEHMLRTHPEDPEVHRQLAYLRTRQSKLIEAVAHMDRAVQGKRTDAVLQREAGLLRELAGYPPAPVELVDNPGGRLRFTSLYDRAHHRSGWRYAIEALHSLHHRNGVRCEGFLEDLFAWQHPRSGVRPGPELLAALRTQAYETRLTSEERHVIPLREPWVGFLHNPPGMPVWFHSDESPQTILSKPVWRESLPHCVGLFTLSEYAAEWLRKETGKPVSAVLHPTETPALCFDFDRFLANPHKLIVQVGWWLRRLGAIDRLPLRSGNPLGYTKLRLIPRFFPGSAVYLSDRREQDFTRHRRPSPDYAANTQERAHVPNDEYDRLLSENIIFVDLLDASANNAVIECLVRATPILVNRLPAVEEYLGAEYPLYFRDLDDAAAMALDVPRLRAAHLYLQECPTRTKLDGDSFRRAVEDSEVYRLLG